MSYIERLVHHEQLMTRMASQNGADIDLALMTGAMTPSDLHEATFRCMGCTQTSNCEKRMEEGELGVPDYCRNADMIAEVRSLVDAQD